ncbi:MAG: hypothetical protein ACKPH7_29830 [Planktothrix sp.]
MQKFEEIVKCSVAGIVAFLMFVFLFNYCQNLGESDFTRNMKEFNKTQQR